MQFTAGQNHDRVNNGRGINTRKLAGSPETSLQNLFAQVPALVSRPAELLSRVWQQHSPHAPRTPQHRAAAAPAATTTGMTVVDGQNSTPAKTRAFPGVSSLAADACGHDTEIHTADTPKAVTAAAGSINRNDRAVSPMHKLYRNSVFAVGILALSGAASAQQLPDFAALVENEGDAVVKISVISGGNANPANGLTPEQLEQLPEFMRRFYEPERQRRGGGFGSGFIISDDGYVITNAHVVDNASDIRVSLSDQREFDAELIGSDRRSDIAVLKLTADELPTVTMGDSDEVKVGEWVLAIGSPFGFEHTATQGIVSAVARNLPDDTYVPFIQTDVAVNPGNSGGPLFNTKGEVIGVNSQIYSRSGGYQGLSFAIPINVARSIADQLRTKGYASRGWLGVQIQDVNQALAESFGLDRPTGALVAQVIADSPALGAGIQTGDIILSFDGKTVTGSSKLPPLVGAVAPDTSVPVVVLRDDREIELQVTIAELETDKPIRKAKLSSGAADGLGVTVQQLQPAELEQIGVENGVAVTAVKPDSPAAEAGIRNGDVIVSVNRRKVTDPESLASISSDLPAGKSVPVLVQRGEVRTFIPVEIPRS